jgi:hypothetical protein
MIQDKFYIALENLLETTDKIDMIKYHEIFMTNCSFVHTDYKIELSHLIISVGQYINNPNQSNKDDLEFKIKRFKSLPPIY